MGVLGGLVPRIDSSPVLKQITHRTQGAPIDDDRLVAHTGLLLPATLARHLGLRELVDRYLDLSDAPGRVNAGDKIATLVSVALAGGDCIKEADALRAGGTPRVLGCAVKTPSTLGILLRSFRWGHVRQLDRVSRALLARAWAAGAGPGEAPFTIDLDSTMCETYELAKEGAQHPGYTGQRGLSPAARGGSRQRRGADGMAALGSCVQRPWRRPLPAGDDGSGPRCRSERAAHGARRQRLLLPRGGRCLPRDRATQRAVVEIETVKINVGADGVVSPKS